MESSTTAKERTVMKTSIRIVTLATVFLFALAASHAFGGTKATRNVSASPFIFEVSLTADGPATLEFGVTDKNNVPYPPIGTPADASLKHIFFVGSGLPEVGSAADYSQLACNFLSGDTPQVWKLQSLADTTVYFSLKEGEDPGDMELPDSSYSPDSLMQKVETQSNVVRGMNALPEFLREAMVLRHVKDMSYDQIARILNCPVGTVKSRIARGRELLRAYLMKMDGEAAPAVPPGKTENTRKAELSQ